MPWAQLGGSTLWPCAWSRSRGREANPCLLWGALERIRVGQAWGQTL